MYFISKYICKMFKLPITLIHRPLAMRKDGIQTRKRKPKKSSNGVKPPQEAAKKDGQNSPGIDGTL